MNCPACAHPNRPGAKFCEECGAVFKRLCPSCSAELRPSAKFCDECGAAVAPPAAARPAEAAGARKIVTIVFADLVGSTALHERLDPESARRFMEGYYAAMRGAVESHGGTVTQFLGDGVKAVFGIPRVAEDDAIRAVRAAVAMQVAFRALADPQRDAIGRTGLRVAVNTGEVVASDASEIIGDPVNVAARLQEQGRDGDVVIGEATQRLVAAQVTLEPLGSFALKGRSEAVKAHRVVSLERPAGAATAPFVGRESELARIRAVYEIAVGKPAAGLAVLLGSPGLGKSRLIEEIARRLGDDAVLIRAHCDAAGGASLAPIADALRALPDLDAAVSGSDAERARILEGVRALLAGSPASPEETFFVVRRLLASLAATKPVVLVIDDVHWAEPLLLDLVEHLVQWGVGVPLLVLVGARPELREVRSTLVTPGGVVSDVVTLSGLDAGAAMRHAANVIGADDLPASVAAKVLATSEGNPLFVGELVRMLVHEGGLKRDGDRWTAGTELAALEIPPTIHALLAARIERLKPEERSVLERAAVIGRSFSRNAVAELMSRDESDLDARLEALRRGELIERDTGWFLGEPLLRFHHVLIRDAAYRRILKGTRAELHARFADWIETRAADSIEHDETIGWHLEQAHQHLRELGPIDAGGRALGERASQRLAAAGRRALARDDVPLAAGLLGRALQALEPEDVARAELALDWCEALLAAGDVGPATRALEELDRFAASDARLRAWHTCFAGQLTALSAPQSLNEAAEAVAKAAGEFAALGDVAGEAKAHFVHAQAFARLGKVGACEASLDRALAAARRAGDRRRANTVLAAAPLAALWGPSPVTRASGRCLDVVRVLRITQGAPAVEAVALSCQGLLEALRGRTDASRRMVASARKMVEELGITQRLLEVDVFAARIDWLDGDVAAAERGLRAAYAGMREIGLGIDAARAGALLARTLLAQDRVPEAEALSHESERLAGDDLQAAIAWRGVRAEALAKRGEHDAAIELAKQAVAIASVTDALLDHADARMALAAALRAADRGPEADAEERRAIELWEAKGASLLAERARRDVAHEMSAPASSVGSPKSPDRARRRVAVNAATRNAERVFAASLAQDPDALAACHAETVLVIHHPTGASYGAPEVFALQRAMWRTRGLSIGLDVLATLGDSLALVRRSYRHDGSSSSFGSVGPAEGDYLCVIEVDEQGLANRSEVFAGDRLAQAIAHLYERYAELQPEGPARARAAATADALAALLGPPDLARIAGAFSPSVETYDHRLLGYGRGRGAENVLRSIRIQLETADGITPRVDDVLAAHPSGLIVRRTVSGVSRDSGGQYEKEMISLYVCDRAGRVARGEQFDPEHEAEALARFDALSAPAELERSDRRAARPNHATRACARFVAAIGARDGDAVANLLAEPLPIVHHPTGTTYGRREMLATWRSALKARRVDFRQEPLASLGDALCLNRQVTSVEGLTEAHVAGFGPTEVHEISLIEADDRGCMVHVELFAPDRLGDAVARLYERHAETLPEGAARERAATTARSLPVIQGPFDLEGWAAAIAPDIEQVDHRLLSTWSARGAAEVVGHFRALREVSDGTLRVDEVLAASPDLLLLRQTNVGTDRASGGRYERVFLSLPTFARDGRIGRIEFFDPEREAEALARFDALAGGVGADSPDDSFANAASRTDALLTRRFNERDWAGVEALAAPELVFDERRRMLHNTCGREIWLQQFRLMFDQPASRLVTRLLATRGERLSLNLHHFTAEVADGGGPLEMEGHFALHEVDRDGRIVAIVLFDQGDLDAAQAELDARFEAGEDGTHGLYARVMRTFARAIETRDWDPVLALCAPSLVEHDHRALAVLGTTRGAEAWVQNFRVLGELAPDSRYRVDHFRSCARGFCTVGVWLGTREGGPYEMPLVAVLSVDEQKRIARADIYDADQRAQARARFDGLDASPRENRGRFRNAASRAWDELDSSWNRADWPRFAELLAPEFRLSERRRLVQLELDRRQYIDEYARPFREMRSAHQNTELLATRGDRLALTRSFVWVSDAAGGPSEIPYLTVVECDARRRIVALVRFDLDDSDAAWAELDARFEAGEGAAHPRALAARVGRRRALEARDWDDFAVLLARDLVCHDHRLLGWGTLHGVAAFVRTQQALVELAPDTRWRDDHVVSVSRGYFQASLLFGTREGGAFELAFLRVAELDEHGKVCRIDIYDPDQRDAALARLAELATAKRESERFENAATRQAERASAAQAARDWQRFGSFFAPGFRNYDRRAMVQLEIDREQFLESYRQIVEITSAPPELQVLATRGDRLAVARLRWKGAEGDIGPTEIDWLLVIEVDSRGDGIAGVTFDPGDIDAAYAELDARFEAGEASAHPRAVASLLNSRRALAARDWDAHATLFAHDLVCHDHRVLGWGTLYGVAAFSRTQRVLIELAPDTRWRNDHIATSERGHFQASLRFGTRDGGDFELEMLRVSELDAQGKICRIDIYDPDQRDQALARFEEIRANTSSEARSAFSKRNAASIAMEHWQATFDIGFDSDDWEPMRALVPPDMLFDDRRRLALVAGDRELMIASARERVAMGARPEMATIGTAGDRVAILRILWSGGPEDGRFEIEYLSVIEVDASGRISALAIFEVDDVRSVQREAWARWAAIDPSSAAVTTALGGLIDAFNAGRVPTELLADALVVEDHRRTGLGRVEGAAACSASLLALLALAPDSTIDLGWQWLAFEPHGALTVIRRTGTIREGGAYEAEHLFLLAVARGRVTRLEFFELEDADRALARFEELRPDPLRIPENAAARSFARRMRAQGNEAELRRFVTDDLSFEDRGHRALVRGGVDEFLNSVRFMLYEVGGRSQDELTATAGDCLALHRVVWREAPGASSFELTRYRVTEVDAEGKLCWVALFDGEQRAEAHTLLFERYVANGADGMARGLVECLAGLNDHDLVRVRSGLCDDLVIEDRRRAALPRIEGADAYVASLLAAHHELSPDLRVDVLYFAAVGRHACVFVGRASGTSMGGGAFESLYVALTRFRGDKLASFEFFEPEQLETALARFEALRPDPRRVPDTTATRARERQRAAFLARDWADIRAHASEDFVFEDRGRRALIEGDIETWLRSMEFTSTPSFRVEREHIAVLGDRICIETVLWRSRPGGEEFEFDRVRITEVDADSRLRAVLFFDREDRPAAFAEALRRFAAGEGSSSSASQAFVTIFEALNARDWAALRDGLTEDLVVVDQRPIGLGSFDRDGWIRALQAAFELSEGLAFEIPQVLAWNERGVVIELRRYGSIPAGGGPFEGSSLAVVQGRGDRVARYELFDESDAERALARFAELTQA